MSSLFKHIQTVHDSFYAQKMANTWPSYARAREVRESNVQRILNTFALYIEDTYRDIRQASKDKFVSSFSAYINGVLYTIRIPQRFLFEQEQAGDSVRYFPPTVIATDGTSNYTLEVVDDLEQLYRALPTRLSLSNEVYSVSDIVSTTAVSNLGNVTIGDIDLPNWIYTTLSGGTEYGTSDKKSFFYPANVALQGLTLKDVIEVEGRIYYSDDIGRSWRIFADIDTIEVENVDTSTQIKMDSWGFNRDNILEQTYSYSRYLDRDPRSLYYALADDTEATGNRTWLSYRIRETNTIQLQRQGFATLVEELGCYLVNDSTQHVTLNDMAKMDISEWLFATDDNNLYIYDVFVPSVTDSYVLQEMKNRTTDAAITLETYPLSQRLFELNKSVTFATRNKNAISGFAKPTRMRLYYVNNSGTKTYLDKAGATVTAANAWRYTELRNRGTTKWTEKKWNVSFSTLGQYAVVLEAEYLDNNKHPITNRNATRLEYNVMPVQVGYKEPLVTLAWPASIRPVKGITFDHNSNLWARSTATGNRAHKINLHFDQCLIDYESYGMYVREPYTSIVSIENTGTYTDTEYVTP